MTRTLRTNKATCLATGQPCMHAHAMRTQSRRGRDSPARCTCTPPLIDGAPCIEQGFPTNTWAYFDRTPCCITGSQQQQQHNQKAPPIPCSMPSKQKGSFKEKETVALSLPSFLSCIHFFCQVKSICHSLHWRAFLVA